MARRSVPERPAPVVLRELDKELACGWSPGVTLLTGEDFYHLDAAQKALLGALVPTEAGEMALTVYGDQRVELSTVISAARSMGMFAAQRVVLVRDMSAVSGEIDALEAYAENPPARSYLLIRAPKLDRRRKFDQALLKHSRVLAFPATDPLRAGALGGAVAGMARKKQLEIDRQAASMLAELCAGDFYRIDSELDKIRAWMGDRPRSVDTEIVREVASGSALLSGWELAGAIGRGDRAAALASARRLVEAGEEPLRIVGGLAFRARGMMQAKAMIARGMNAQQAIRAARLFGDSSQQMARGISRYTVDELLRFPSHLLEADRTLKSRSVPKQAVMEALVDRMSPAKPEESGRR